MKKIAVYSVAKLYDKRALELADQLKLSVFRKDKSINIDYLLYVGQTLSLVPYPPQRSPRGKGICIDFLGGALYYRQIYGSGKTELIAKAVGLKKYGIPLRVLDATAGLGQDAFVLASLGCEVLMLERSPIIYVLLQDALRRASDAKSAASARLKLIQCQGVDFIQSLKQRPFANYPDVIYLDPMYSLTNRKALPNKNAYILREIVGPDEDTEALLKVALACYAKRVVLKRPRLAKDFLGLTPELQYVGKSTRFDVFFPK